MDVLKGSWEHLDDNSIPLQENPEHRDSYLACIYKHFWYVPRILCVGNADFHYGMFSGACDGIHA